MIGLDTNVIVRYLVQDDADQAARATAFIERELSEEAPGWISVVTAAELVWVLLRAYGFSRIEVARAVERLLQADSLVFAHQDEVFEAMSALEAGHDFADALIAALGKAAGCGHTVTFDKKAARLPAFYAL